MKLLTQHPDFNILLQNAADSLKIRPALVLKDYWVTAVLRVLAASDFRGKFLFKGGTSLSKGWKLIDRFSEDVDLLLTGKDFSGPPDRKSDREKQMKAMRDYVSAKLPLAIPDQTDRFFYYRDDWHMEAQYVWDQPKAKRPLVEETVLLEVGFRGGANPHNLVTLNSMVGDYIYGQRIQDQADLQEYRADFDPFDLELLSPARTFFEKLLHLYGCLGADISKLKTRHLYDVVQIFRKDSAVRDLIASGQYSPILKEAVEVSNRWYQADLDPSKIDLQKGLVLRDDQAVPLAKAYTQEADYYFKGQPSFEDLRKGLDEIRTAFPTLAA